MKATLQIIKVVAVSLLLTGGSLWLVTIKISAQKSLPSIQAADQPVQALIQHDTSTHLSSQILTSYLYLPFVIDETLFDRVSFSVTGSSFAVPAIDDRYIYVGSGFANDCINTGEIRAFDKTTLNLVWKTDVAGAIGDTNLTLANDQLIFGAGDGVVALAAGDGRRTWQLHLNGCFQESFIRLHQNRLYLGSSSGHIYGLTTQGQVLWQNRLPGPVFAAPAVFSDMLYFADMTNTLTAIVLKTGQIEWQVTLPIDPGKEPGIFAGPLFYDNSLFITTYSGDVWRIPLTGDGFEARHTSSNRYVASPVVCDGKIVVANLAGQVEWLDIANLRSRYKMITAEPFLFGTPQCVNDVIIVTSYGDLFTPSALYYLQRGQILKQLKFPCCKSALTTTAIDGPRVYNVLTTLGWIKEEVDLIRSKFAFGP